MVPGALELYYRRKKKAFPLPDGSLQDGEMLEKHDSRRGFATARPAAGPGAASGRHLEGRASIDAIEAALEKLGSAFTLTQEG